MYRGTVINPVTSTMLPYQPNTLIAVIVVSNHVHLISLPCVSPLVVVIESAAAFCAVVMKGIDKR